MTPGTNETAKNTRFKLAGLVLMIVLYLGAGINHFIRPGFYLAIMPPWIPFHAAMVFISGVAEVLLAILLIFPATRKPAAWGIIFLLIAVFPANVQMMINYINEGNPKTWISVVRLPLQFVLVLWAYVYARK